MSLIPACSWRRAEYAPGYRSRIGGVVVELTSGEGRRPGVKRGSVESRRVKAKC